MNEPDTNTADTKVKVCVLCHSKKKKCNRLVQYPCKLCEAKGVECVAYIPQTRGRKRGSRNTTKKGVSKLPLRPTDFGYDGKIDQVWLITQRTYFDSILIQTAAGGRTMESFSGHM